MNTRSYNTPLDQIMDLIRNDYADAKTGRVHSIVIAVATNFTIGIAIGLGVAAGLAIAG